MYKYDFKPREASLTPTGWNVQPPSPYACMNDFLGRNTLLTLCRNYVLWRNTLLTLCMHKVIILWPKICKKNPSNWSWIWIRLPTFIILTKITYKRRKKGQYSWTSFVIFLIFFVYIFNFSKTTWICYCQNCMNNGPGKCDFLHVHHKKWWSLWRR